MCCIQCCPRIVLSSWKWTTLCSTSTVHNNKFTSCTFGGEDNSTKRPDREHKWTSSEDDAKEFSRGWFFFAWFNFITGVNPPDAADFPLLLLSSKVLSVLRPSLANSIYFVIHISIRKRSCWCSAAEWEMMRFCSHHSPNEERELSLGVPLNSATQIAANCCLRGERKKLMVVWSELWLWLSGKNWVPFEFSLYLQNVKLRWRGVWMRRRI